MDDPLIAQAAVYLTGKLTAGLPHSYHYLWTHMIYKSVYRTLEKDREFFCKIMEEMVDDEARTT